VKVGVRGRRGKSPGVCPSTLNVQAPLHTLPGVKLFACSTCRQLVFFENVACTRCGQALAYLPDRGLVSGIDAIDAAPGTLPGQAPPAQAWRAAAADGAAYRLCRNWTDHAVCNWAVPTDDPHELCRACRLNLVIPQLSDPAARAAWARLERAKRRLVYSLLRVGLPVEPKPQAEDRGLAFSFMRDLPGEKVWTGHHDGVITINIAEADDPFREKMRVQLGETYRTLLGHLRHEVGHYYWDRLVASGDRLARCRELFGDERADYATALQRHYQAPAPDWPARFVSAYASAHPWEDFAESFAHYLHMVDTLETARAHGLSMRPEATTPGAEVRQPEVSSRRVALDDFDDLSRGFASLALALNDLNRSMGTNDPYPFVLSPAAIEKLRFVHEVVQESGRS
jgi:hypothetical protein